MDKAVKDLQSGFAEPFRWFRKDEIILTSPVFSVRRISVSVAFAMASTLKSANFPQRVQGKSHRRHEQIYRPRPHDFSCTTRLRRENPFS